MSHNQSIFELLEDTLKNIEEIKSKVLTIENDIKNKQIVKPRLDIDEIVLESLKRGFVTLDMVDEKYSKDKNFVKIAIEANSENINYIDDSIVEDFIKHFKNLLKEDGLKLKDCPFSIQNNKELCNLAINQNFEAFKFVKNEELLNNRNLALELVDKNGLLLEFVNENLKKDFEVVITAISNNNDVKEFISDEIKEKIISLFSYFKK
jgi:hypothetical protein